MSYTLFSGPRFGAEVRSTVDSVVMYFVLGVVFGPLVTTS